MPGPRKSALGPLEVDACTLGGRRPDLGGRRLDPWRSAPGHPEVDARTLAGRRVDLGGRSVDLQRSERGPRRSERGPSEVGARTLGPGTPRLMLGGPALRARTAGRGAWSPAGAARSTDREARSLGVGARDPAHGGRSIDPPCSKRGARRPEPGWRSWQLPPRGSERERRSLEHHGRSSELGPVMLEPRRAASGARPTEPAAPAARLAGQASGLETARPGPGASSLDAPTADRDARSPELAATTPALRPRPSEAGRWCPRRAVVGADGASPQRSGAAMISRSTG